VGPGASLTREDLAVPLKLGSFPFPDAEVAVAASFGPDCLSNQELPGEMCAEVAVPAVET
jgi:hypothetical protein